MTIRKTSLGLAILWSVVIGATATFGGLRPFWLRDLDDLRTQRDNLAARLEQLRAEHEQTRADLQRAAATVRETEQRLGGAVAELQERAGRVDAYQQALSEQQAAAEGAARRLTDLGEDLRLSGQREGAAAGRTAELQQRLARLQDEMQTLAETTGRENQKLTQNLQVAEREILRLRNQFNQAQADRGRSARDAEGRLAALREELRQSQERVSQLEDDLDDAEDALRRIRRQADTSDQTRRTAEQKLTQELNRAQNEVRGLRAENARLKDRVRDLINAGDARQADQQASKSADAADLVTRRSK